VARARAADPTWRPGPEDLDAVATLCRRLDGLPLAIELAAARIRIARPAQQLEHLDDQLTTLQAIRRDGPDHHRSMQATLDWSCDLLGPDERAVLARLGVFAGSFTIAAAEAVCASDDVERTEVAAVVHRLVDRSLVTTVDDGGQVRFRLLELVRQHSLARLGDEAHAVRAGIWPTTSPWPGKPTSACAPRSCPAGCTCSSVQHQPGRGPGLRLRARSRASGALTAALGWYWFVTGRQNDLLRHLAPVLAVTDADPVDRGWVVTLAGFWSSPEEGRALAEEGLALLTGRDAEKAASASLSMSHAA